MAVEISGRESGLGAAAIATGVAGFKADCSIFLESSLFLVGATLMATGVAGFNADCSNFLESFLTGATMPYPAMDETRGSGVKTFTLAGLDVGLSIAGVVVSAWTRLVERPFQSGLKVSDSAFFGSGMLAAGVG